MELHKDEGGSQVMTLKEQLDRCPNQQVVDKVDIYLRQWVYSCVWWERWAISCFGSRGEKCKLSQRLTRISRGTGS